MRCSHSMRAQQRQPGIFTHLDAVILPRTHKDWLSRDPFNCGYCALMSAPDYTEKFSARAQVPESDVPGRGSSGKYLRTIWGQVKRKSVSKIITETTGRDVPLRKASERTPPSRMNTRISLSSARMS